MARSLVKFSEVVYLPHAANTERAVFVELQMMSGNSLLEATCGADAFELSSMKDVADRSCMQTTSGEDQIIRTGTMVGHGVYAVVTKEILIVVNGVHMSSFAHNHWLTNKYYNIHRALYEIDPALMKNWDVIAANRSIGALALSL
jgi:hypothetical protein